MTKKTTKKFLSILLACLLVLGFSPAVYAAEDTGQSDAAAGSEETVPPASSEVLVEESAPNLADEASETAPLPEVPTIPEMADATPVETDGSNTSGEETGTETSFEPQAATGSYQVNYEQQPNSTVVKVSVPNAASLISMGLANRMTVEAAMTYGGKTVRSAEATKSLSEVVASSSSFTMNFGTYGPFSIVTKFYLGDTLVRTDDVVTFGVVANEYNIAPLTATLPITFLSLSLWGDESIRYDNQGNIVPTIVMLERAHAWNWNKLPQGVYGLPYLSQSDLAYYPDSDLTALRLFLQRVAIVKDYVKGLYEISPSAVFHLYVNDYDIGLVQEILYANKIPQNQYTITALSDGTFSYTNFQQTYNGSNASTVNQTMKSAWNVARAQAYSTGATKAPFSGRGCYAYAWAAVDYETKAEYWLGRPALFTSNGDGDTFGAAVRANPKARAININTMLTALKDQGPQAVAEFKALYNFNDSYFAEAEATGKQVMMFLGSRVDLEGPFDDFARFVETYYGDEFLYYYKGHPASPTAMNPSKQAQLDSLGIIDIDSSIAAELILFFNPEIKMAGYGSTTYDAVADPDMCRGLFLLPPDNTMAKAIASNVPRYSMFDFFIAAANSNADSRIRALCRSGARSYIVEFSDAASAAEGYDVAIWEPDATIIRYYKLEGNAYKLVDELIGSRLVTIGAASAPKQLVDISGRSTQPGGNAHIWSANRGANQRFRLSLVSDGYYTVQNVGSGLVLDVIGRGSAPGTNVAQWTPNNGDNQKWQLVPTGDANGSYYLVSKSCGLYLDMNGQKTTNGTNLQVWTYNGGPAQKFIISDVQSTVDDGTYRIGSALSSQVLDISSDSTKDGAAALTYQRKTSNNGNQLFNLVFDPSSGYYSIQASHSNKFLDVRGYSWDAGTPVIQWVDNGGLNQRWDLIPLSNGQYQIASAYSGMVLDISGASSALGSPVIVWTSHGQANQRWTLTKTS
ncbi:MAG: RICIN domain-containing protein [Coriobacteriales bacterium]|jgi:cytoskeletal protein RodZ|nr:RICIN domain-containing protein [Coriobacteriales bacterium]